MWAVIEKVEGGVMSSEANLARVKVREPLAEFLGL